MVLTGLAKSKLLPVLKHFLRVALSEKAFFDYKFHSDTPRAKNSFAQVLGLLYP